LAPVLFAGSSNGSATAQVSFAPAGSVDPNLDNIREMKVSSSRTKRATKRGVSRRQVNQESSLTVRSGEARNDGEPDQNGKLLTLQKIILRLVRGERMSAPLASGNGNGEAWPSGRNGHTDEQPKSAIRSGVPLKAPASSGLPLWKRFLDVSLIVLTLIFWLPLMSLLMGWIRMVSPGPIFYRQQRIGYRGGRFMIFKFRTMRVDADTRTHEEYFARLMETDCPMVKLDAAGDSRLIRGGRFLRASGLDELPQIFNVLRGEMSLVGPRPCLPTEFDRYEQWQRERFDVAPGLTGYWQVNGKNNTTFKEMIAMDIFYVRKVSILLDLKIILQTVPTLLREIGSTVRRRAGKTFDFVMHRERPIAGANGTLNNR
jgi:lipopolysaccharide/colanic/teichoic acid biosynthesis glycosyltransferase